MNKLSRIEKRRREIQFRRLVNVLKSELIAGFECQYPDIEDFEILYKADIKLINDIEPNWYENFKKDFIKNY